jgi:hypothetical protein
LWQTKIWITLIERADFAAKLVDRQTLNCVANGAKLRQNHAEVSVRETPDVSTDQAKQEVFFE